MHPLAPDGNLLIILINGYGDGLLALPALREIARRFSSNHVHMICLHDQVDVLYRSLDFRFVPVRAQNNRWVLPKDLTSLNVQQLVNFNAYFPCPVESELSQHFQNLPRWAFCDLLGAPVSPESNSISPHMRDQYFKVLGWEPAYSLADRQVFLSDDWQQKAGEMLQKLTGVKGNRLYALHLDSLPEKMWALDNWIDLVAYIWSHWQAWPLIVGEETADARQLEERFWFASKLPSQLGIALHFAAVKLAPVFIGIDSVFAHVADSYQEPSIILFGPTNFDIWGPISHTSSLVRADGGNEMHHVSLTKVKAAVDARFNAIF